jgi:site-specific recombinase
LAVKDVKPGETGTVHVVAFYIGYNFFLLIGIILLIIAYAIRKKIKRKAEGDLIDSIGKEEGKDLL